MKFLIRELKREDSAQLNSLKRQFLKLMDEYSNDYINKFSEGYILHKEYESTKELPIFVAIDKDAIIGYVEMFYESDYIKTGDTCLVMTEMFVAEEYRSNGVGKKFMKIATNMALKNQNDFVCCLIIKRNSTAKKFIKRCGFKKNAEEIYILPVK